MIDILERSQVLLSRTTTAVMTHLQKMVSTRSTSSTGIIEWNTPKKYSVSRTTFGSSSKTYVVKKSSIALITYLQPLIKIWTTDVILEKLNSTIASQARKASHRLEKYRMTHAQSTTALMIRALNAHISHLKLKNFKNRYDYLLLSFNHWTR